MRKLGIFIFCLTFVLSFTPLAFCQEEQGANKPEVNKEEATQTTELMDEGVVTGELVSVDTTANTIAVKLESGEKTFSVVEGETILWRGIEDIKISDLNQGEKVEVGYYTNEDGNLVASWVDVLIKEEKTLPVETKPEEKGSSEGGH